jgi:hypothetical protein
MPNRPLTDKIDAVLAEHGPMSLHALVGHLFPQGTPLARGPRSTPTERIQGLRRCIAANGYETTGHPGSTVSLMIHPRSPEAIAAGRAARAARLEALRAIHRTSSSDNKAA